MFREVHMSNLSKLKKYAKDPLLVLLRYLCNHPSWFSDESYVKIKYRYFTGRHLNLKNPKTFNEKLQWLKLYNHNPLYTQCVDKIEVKKYVESVIGGVHYTNNNDLGFSR